MSLESPQVNGPDRLKARLGMTLFIRASMLCPVSVVAQGAYIAHSCQKSGERPESLGNSLLLEDDLIENLVRVANAAHRRVKKRFTPINEDQVTGIIIADFTWAKQLLILSQDDLREIYEGLYSRYRAMSPGHATINQFIEDEVEAKWGII